MLIQSSFSEKDKSSNLNINKSQGHVNRGLEFILNGRKKKPSKQIHIVLSKVLCIFKRELDIHFEFSFSLRKKN